MVRTMHMRIIWGILCCLSLVIAFGPVRKLRLPLWCRWILGFFAFSAAQGYVLQKLFDASVMCPDKLPFFLLVPAKWGDIAILLTGLFSLAWILLRLCRIKCPAWVSLCSGMVLGGVMLWLGVRQPPVQERLLEVANLPAEAEGVRIAVIADLHIDCWRGKRWCETFVARLNALQPDIVAFTGDQVDGEIECRREDLSPLAAIQAPGGKFLISGNHEFMFDAEGYLGLYEALGLTVLDGRIATSRGITFVGLPDERSLVVSHNVPILDRLVKELPPEAFSVLLVHKPGIAPEADARGIDVQFSGHTHGGQFPGLAWIMERFNHGFVRGFYTLPGGMQLFVAPGSAAWIGFPYRFFYTSELTLFTLKRAPHAE